MSPDERLLSVAEIARRLGVPESTVHYWKNRFAQHLPSTGAGRQKRFRPEAVEVFRVIAEMFSLGHSAADVMDALGKQFPLSAHIDGAADAAGTDAPFRPRPQSGELAAAPGALADTALRVAAAIGQEIARSIGEGLARLSLPAAAGEGAVALPSVPPEELAAIKDAVEQSCGRIDETSGEVARMAAENAELKAKLAVLENELVRLRKDRREMEKYLLDKIKSVST